VSRPRYTSLARLDIVEASDFYDRQSRHLGADFTAAVERAGWLLAENPGLGEAFTPQHQEFPLEDFPYTLYYELIERGIRVVAVLHQSRSPRYVRSRIR
jgi:plasmid stabilization system protein ParE